MKASGNKISMVISAVILGSMLIVPILPAEFYSGSHDSGEESQGFKSIEYQETLSNGEVSVGFSIGSELSVRI